MILQYPQLKKELRVCVMLAMVNFRTVITVLVGGGGDTVCQVPPHTLQLDRMPELNFSGFVCEQFYFPVILRWPLVCAEAE
jgi:hypothetical protein